MAKTQLELTETPDPDTSKVPPHLLTYNLVVKCVDEGTASNGGQKTGTATVTVNMETVNDFTPNITTSNSVYSVS